MKSIRQFACVGLVAVCVIIPFVVAAPPAATKGSLGNSYYSYTKAIPADESGVVAIPSRFKWNVETGSAGFDIQGKPLPDARIMLRLYDPNEPYSTAFIAQMDLATAARLHHELGDVLVNKLQNPNFEHRPRYYDPERIPAGKFKGIDQKGQAIIELEYPQRQPIPAK